MRRPILPVALVAFGFFVPSVAVAQSAIAGVVKDTSGAVLPGVSVEASSPALIEKVKSATTNEAGQYRVVDLRPGTYTVTFTLSGFSTIVREGIVLEANFTAPVNVELTVGNVTETITVTGETPIVDVQTSQRREVVPQVLLETVPTGRNYVLMAGMLPSVTTGAYDVGGSSTMQSGGSLLVHGSLAGDSRNLIDGIMADGMFSAGQCSCIYDNEAQTQEMVVQVSGGAAENQLSGVLVNRIPRMGGNNFSGDTLVTFSNTGLQSTNLDDDLRARGLTTAGRLYRQYDINYSMGGPIIRDRLWFFASGRHWAYNNYVENTFNPDGTQAQDENALKAFPFRLTAQLTTKNRVTWLYDRGFKYQPHNGLAANVAPEASLQVDPPGEKLTQGKWTATMTNHLLFEAGFNYMYHGARYQYQPEVIVGTCHVAFNLCAPGTGYGSIAHQDTLLATRTVAPSASATNGSGPQHSPSASKVAQASLSYVSGAHAFKVGFQHRWGWKTDTRQDINADLVQLYRSGAPFAVNVLNTPVASKVDVNADLGLFVQDTWTTKRLTVSPGLRFDHFNASIPEQTVAAGRFVPARHFDPIPDFPNWNNVAPRLGASYDLSGRGTTAVKGNVGLYIQGYGTGFGEAYNPMITSTDQRTWTDLNRDDIAQENEIGPPSNTTFGVRRNTNPDPNITRPYQWVWDIGLQHEIMPRIGVSVSYNQRNFYEIFWTDNLALAPTDYTLVTIPDPRGNGQTLPVFNIDRAKFGQVNELDSNSSLNNRMFRSVDFSFNIRVPGGGSVTGGTSTGRTVTSTCQVEDLNSLRFCDQTEYDVPYLTLVKLAGSYPLPYGLRLSGTFQGIPATERVITYQVTRAQIPTLSQTSVNVRLNEPGSEYNDRVNQLDLSLAYSFKSRGLDVRPELALFNVFNANPVLTQTNVYGPALGQVTSVLKPRVLRLGVMVKF